MQKLNMSQTQYEVLLILLNTRKRDFPGETKKIENIIRSYANQLVPDYFGFKQFIYQELKKDKVSMPFLEVSKSSKDVFLTSEYIFLLTIRSIYECENDIVEINHDNINLIKLHFSNFNSSERIIRTLIGSLNMVNNVNTLSNIRNLSEYETKALFFNAYSDNNRDLAFKALARLNTLDDGEYDYFEGLIYYKDQQYDKAIGFLKLVENNQPDYVAAQLTLIKIYAILGLHEDFINTVKNVVTDVNGNMILWYAQILLINCNEDEFNEVLRQVTNFLDSYYKIMQQRQLYEIELKENTIRLLIEKRELIEELSFLRQSQVNNDIYIKSVKHRINVIDKAVKITNPKYTFLTSKIEDKMYYEKITSTYLKDYINFIDQSIHKRSINLKFNEETCQINSLLITQLRLLLLDKKQVLQEYFFILGTKLLIRQQMLLFKGEKFEDDVNENFLTKNQIDGETFNDPDLFTEESLKESLSEIITSCPDILTQNEIDEFDIVFNDAIEFGDEKTYRFALVHAEGLGLLSESTIEKIEKHEIFRTLSPRGKVAFASAESNASKNDMHKKSWLDAGNIALSYYKILEIEFNFRLICPVVRSIEIETFKQTYFSYCNSLKKKHLEDFKRQWNKIFRKILVLQQGKHNTMLIGEMYQLLQGISGPADRLNDFSSYLREKFVPFLTVKGLNDLENGSIYECLSSVYRNKYRNPPAHTEYLSNQIAIEAVEFSKTQLRYLSTCFVM